MSIQRGSVVSGSDDSAESAATVVLSVALAADSIERRDRSGGPSGQHDLDVRVKERLVAVEVTRSTQAAARAYAAAVEETPWLADDLRHGWVLNPTGHPNLKTLRQGCVPLLQQLEGDGVIRIEQSLGGFPTETRSTGRVREAGMAGAQLLGLGIDEARCLGPGRGQIFLHWPVESAFEDPDAVAVAVETEARANADKLGRADADERHLFVWVELDNWPAWLGIRSNRVSEARAPVLPPTIDVVWAAGLVLAHKPGIVLWKATRGTAWSSIPVDALAARRIAEELGLGRHPEA